MLKKIWNTYMVFVEIVAVWIPLIAVMAVLGVVNATWLVGKYALGASIVFAILH